MRSILWHQPEKYQQKEKEDAVRSAQTFRKYKIKTIENNHTHLVPEELERLENLILSGRYVKLQKSLDAFMFCCYAGMR